MIKHTLSSKHKGFGAALILSMAAYALPAQAKLVTWYTPQPWRTVLSVALGGSITSDAGQARSFPIVNPVTDEFYSYSPDKDLSAQWLVDGFIGVEWDVNCNWIFQLGLDYNQTTPFYAKGSFVQGADAPSSNTFSYEYNILARQLLVEGKLLYSIKCLHPYFLVGLGTAFNKANNYSTNVPPFLTFTRKYGNHTSTSFSYAIGVGLDYDISKCMRAGIGYRFADLGTVKLGNAVIDTTPVRGTLSQSVFRTNEGYVQLTWLFG